MASPYFYQHLSGAERDQALIDALKSVVREKPNLRPQAEKLMGEAATGRFKAGWAEDCEALIARAFPKSVLNAGKAGAA